MENESQELNSLVGNFYQCFDNRMNRLPDFNRFISLFIDGATIGKRTESQTTLWSLPEFWKPRADLLRNGQLVDFHEWETDFKNVIFDGIAMRQSFYEKAGSLDRHTYTGQGVKHFQIIKVGGVWRIAHLMWQDFE